MSEPFARAPDFSEYGAGNFKHKVSDEEDSAAEAKNRARKSQVTGHLQGGEANVHSVQKSHEKKQKDKRHQA